MSRPEDSEGGRLIGSGGESSGEGDTPGKGADTRDARGDTRGEGASSEDCGDPIEGSTPSNEDDDTFDGVGATSDEGSDAPSACWA